MANPGVLEEQDMKPQNSSRGDFQEIAPSIGVIHQVKDGMAPSVDSVHKTNIDHRSRLSSFSRNYAHSNQKGINGGLLVREDRIENGSMVSLVGLDTMTNNLMMFNSDD